MVANTTPCTPLYEPGAPPPPLPLLTAQMDLFDNPFRPTTLVNTVTQRREPMPTQHESRSSRCSNSRKPLFPTEHHRHSYMTWSTIILTSQSATLGKASSCFEFIHYIGSCLHVCRRPTSFLMSMAIVAVGPSQILSRCV